MTLQVASLHCYPVKSLQGIDLRTSTVGPRGLQWDRHWMLVDSQGQFLSQRKLPKMATITTQLDETQLTLSQTGLRDLAIPLQYTGPAALTTVNIWKDSCQAQTEGKQAQEWFREALGADCQLVHLPATETRAVDPNYAHAGDQTAFSDGFPILVLSQSAMELMSQKMGQNVPTNRFRANIIVSGCAAHAEDDWDAIQVGALTLRLPKRCSRCVIPSIDQNTGEKHLNPNTVLKDYRRFENKIYVGKNAIAETYGRVSVGDEVIVLHNKPAF